MSANKIAETSTTTGTGDVTLDGAWSVPSSFITGNRTFNSFYGLSHRFPYMIQDQSGNWEKGRGYLSSSTTLVRETVIDNSLSTTALINFPAGDKLVMVPTDAGSLWPETLDAGKYMLTPSIAGFSSGTTTIAANLISICIFNALRPIAVTGLVVEVTAQAGQGLKPIIYKARNQESSSMTIDLVAAGTPITLSGTGKVSMSISANLGQGFYMVGVVSDGAPTLRTNGSTAVTFNGFDNGFSGNVIGMLQASVAGSYAAPPTTRTGTFAATGSSIRVGLEGRFL